MQESAQLYATKTLISSEKPQVPDAYPQFGVGDTVEIEGYPFVVVRLNSSSMVVRPVPSEGVSRSKSVMRKMTSGGRKELVQVVSAFVARYSAHATPEELKRVRAALDRLRGFWR